MALFFPFWGYSQREALEKHDLCISSQWRHSEPDGVSNHQCIDCLLNRIIQSRSKKTTKLRVTGLCEGNSPETGEFSTQRARNAKNVSIWWRHHDDKIHVNVQSPTVSMHTAHGNRQPAADDIRNMPCFLIWSMVKLPTSITIMSIYSLWSRCNFNESLLQAPLFD